MYELPRRSSHSIDDRAKVIRANLPSFTTEEVLLTSSCLILSLLKPTAPLNSNATPYPVPDTQRLDNVPRVEQGLSLNPGLDVLAESLESFHVSLLGGPLDTQTLSVVGLGDLCHVSTSASLRSVCCSEGHTMWK